MTVDVDVSVMFCLVLGETGGNELFRSERRESKLLSSHMLDEVPLMLLLPVL